MRRATSLVALSLFSIVLAACAARDRTPAVGAADPDLAAAAVTYSAAMRSGSGEELRQRSCGAYAVVYRNTSDTKLETLRRSAARRKGVFDGSTVVRAEQHGTDGEVTLADMYLRGGVRVAGRRYTFVMSKDSGSWKVCDSRSAGDDRVGSGVAPIDFERK